MFVKTGQYTGNGVASGTTNAVTGIGFRPRFVLIKRYNSTELPIARSESMAANNSKLVVGAIAIQTTTGITSLDSDGFTLTGQDATSNANGGTYFYIAVGNEAADFMYGSYTGNAADNRNITIGGSFSATPDLVIVMGENADRAVWGSSDMSADLSGGFNQAFGADIIQAFGAGTFQVGTNAQVNSNAVVYHYVAFKKSTGVCTTFTYTGNGSDNRNITGFGFQPTCAYIQRSGFTGVIRNAVAHSGDSSSIFDNTGTNAADIIQAFQSDGIQIGTDSRVNSNGATYYGFAFNDSFPSTGSSSSFIVVHDYQMPIRRQNVRDRGYLFNNLLVNGGGGSGGSGGSPPVLITGKLRRTNTDGGMNQPRMTGGMIG